MTVEAAALRDAASILRKLAVYCDFREMRGACEFNDSEMAYLTALAAGGPLKERPDGPSILMRDAISADERRGRESSDDT